MTSFNNNHAMDFSYEGLLRTLDYLNASNFVHAGVGRNLDEAMAPKFIDTKEGRVALISMHAHDMQGTKKENHAQFIEELAHKCVDFGADAVVGHGPHLIGAVEVYMVTKNTMRRIVFFILN